MFAGTDDAPGTTSKNPTSGMISKLEDFVYFIRWNRVKKVMKTLR